MHAVLRISGCLHDLGLDGEGNVRRGTLGLSSCERDGVALGPLHLCLLCLLRSVCLELGEGGAREATCQFHGCVVGGR